MTVQIEVDEKLSAEAEIFVNDLNFNYAEMPLTLYGRICIA